MEENYKTDNVRFHIYDKTGELVLYYYTVLYGTVLYSTVLYCTVLYSTVLYSIDQR